jgi:hypothetical protein
MALEQEIEGIRAGIRAGRFPNEASVSQGIVLRLLNALDWPTFEPEHVSPEYALGGRRVDFALCSPPPRPFAFIEVKQIGQSNSAERQLFEYAFHAGVPMAILTDGREWNFFLPSGQGNYGERRVYKLDLVERNLEDCVKTLRRYLLHSEVVSGAALQHAQDDYQNVAKERQITATLPLAWKQIIEEGDELLIEIIADRVESLCGYKPGPDIVAQFLRDGDGTAFAINTQPTAVRAVTREPRTFAYSEPVIQVTRSVESSAPNPDSRPIGFALDGRVHSARNAIDTLKQIFEVLEQRDATFAERFAGLPLHGRSRRYLARDPALLYPGRDDLAREYSTKLPSGWWMSTNHSKQTIAKIIEMACNVVGISFGRDLVANLGD